MTVQDTFHRTTPHVSRSVDRQDAPQESHNLVLDVAGRRAWFRRQELHLTPREFSVLLYLARRGGRLVPADEILADVWGADTDATDVALRTVIKRLRRKMGDDSKWQRYITNVWGRGYRLALRIANRNATFFLLLQPIEDF